MDSLATGYKGRVLERPPRQSEVENEAPASAPAGQHAPRRVRRRAHQVEGLVRVGHPRGLDRPRRPRPGRRVEKVLMAIDKTC